MKRQKRVNWVKVVGFWRVGKFLEGVGKFSAGAKSGGDEDQRDVGNATARVDILSASGGVGV